YSPPPRLPPFPTRRSSDLHVDAHHTVEDVAIVLGQALKQALGDKAGIRRFGDATVPLDEALVQAIVDVAGRPYCVHTGEPAGQRSEEHTSELQSRENLVCR